MSPLLTGCKNVSIYLGDKCNFNCSYCDREFVDSLGSQHMTIEDVEHVAEFILSAELNKCPPEMFSFHGGEPFTYVKIMDKFMDKIVSIVPSDYPFYIQTNGSQMLQHKWFFEKWSNKLEISISYDFLYQDINRSLFEIKETLDMLNAANVRGIQFQYVMPIADPKVFSFKAIKSITDICHKNNVKRVNLIPLRHIRGKDKFKVIVDDLDLAQFFNAFIKFIHILYTMDIDVIVDGHGHGFDKHYFENHKLMILSPDGYIYPEYDFLEYKREETRLGKWKNGIEIARIRDNEDQMLRPNCLSCPARDLCGLKYLHGMFGTDPQSNKCIEFYQKLSIVIQHAQKLKQHPTFFHWVGI
jgi:radical SAM protein with 4Fe4S-binding SPASM domain